MNSAQAQNTVVVGGVVCAIAITVGAIAKGSLPKPRRLLATGIVFVALAALADTQPRIAGPATGLVTVAVVLANGTDALAGVQKAATSSAKLGTGTLPRRGAPVAFAPSAPGAASDGGLTTDGLPRPNNAIPGSPVPGIPPHAATHQTAGLPGYPAYDYMAPAGTTAVSPVDGVVWRLSGKDPKLGGAPGGPLGYSIYINGRNGQKYFLTHLDRVSVRAGQAVKQGQPIAVIADGPASWSSPHVHMGVSAR